jgi:hypothetical protein
MSENLVNPAGESDNAGAKRPGILGAIALVRRFTPGEVLARGLSETRRTKPTLGDVAEGVETELNHAAAVHAEHETGGDWDFPDKDFGYMDPNDPTSVYPGRDN